MKIVHVASELFPYVKTGGLADAVGALTGALADRGHEVAVYLPGYRAVLEHKDAAAAERTHRLKVEQGIDFLSGEVRSFSPRPGVTVHLVCREEFFDRRGAYGNGERDYDDNSERFIFFSKAVVESLRLSDAGADIVHCHDWQAALVPVLLRESERRHGVTLALKTIFTIHNIAFQGVFPAKMFPRTNLPDELYAIDGLEYYSQINLLKGGILFSDRVTTVSPRYAKEIQTPEFGCGLDGVAQTRAEDLIGLLNGVDTAIWNPGTDPLLPARYSAGDLAGKKACRAELLKRCGFAANAKGPVYGIVARLTQQKGIDFVLANRDFFLAEDVRLVVLGAGDRRMEDELRELAARAPANVNLSAKLDEAMSHLIEAGSDFFVMPSAFEPCGLNQMYSLRYGAIPIVRRTGGLDDSVVDLTENADLANGIKFTEFTSRALAGAIRKALVLYRTPDLFAQMRKNGMTADFSWDRTTVEYEKVYRRALA